MINSDLSPLVAAWRSSATDSGALLPPEKALSRVQHGFDLGLWVDDSLGAASVPAESLADLVSFTSFALALPNVSLKLFQILLGRWMPCITLRRELMPVFRSVWHAMSSIPFRGISPASQ